ncbi:22316_t:CDS:2 [Dentiscutata erythropus]|uniref:22316_t:CDS:1 n=1 Tax=Dentiscutata erythropus TaxID=1348616 RepID=A0A9N9GDQ3_9GLOM|nr:22316_t:CDS:2 [Dentiscutata erythropus]
MLLRFLSHGSATSIGRFHHENIKIKYDFIVNEDLQKGRGLKYSSIIPSYFSKCIETGS